MSAFLSAMGFFVLTLYPKLGGWMVEAAKSGAIVITGALIAVLFARRSAVARCAVMRATVVGLLVAAAWHVAPPALESLRPKVAVARPLANGRLAFETAISAGVIRSNEAAQQAASIRHERQMESQVAPPAIEIEDPSGVSPADYRTKVFEQMENHVTQLWFGGFALLLAWRVLRVTLGLRWLKAKTRTAPDTIKGVALQVSESLGLKSQIECRVGAAINSPLVTGWRNARLWLPEACSEWPEEQLQAVLHHELAHVKRRDAIWQSLGSLASAFWWWNPLVWWLARRLRSESEFAADEVVLCGRASGPDYAETLVRVASTVGTAPCVSAGLPMIGRSPIEQRVRAILTENPFRGRAGWMGVTGAAVVLAGGLIAAAVVAQSANLIGAAGPPLKLTDAQRKLAEPAVAALKARLDRLRYLHFKLEEEWTERNDKGEGTKSSPMPTKVEVWTDEHTGVHRAVYTPSVSPWSNGAAPAYIENRTDINDGKKHYEINDRDGVDDMRTHDKPEGLQRLLGVIHEQEVLRRLTSLITTGSAGAKGLFERKLVETEHEGRKVLEVREEMPGGEGDDAVTQREVWLLDPAKDYALVIHTMKFPKNPSSSFWMWKADEIERTAAGDWYPKRHSFSQISNGIQKSEYRTRVTHFERLEKLPEGLFDLPKSDRDRFVAKDGKATQLENIDIKIVDVRTGDALPGTKVDYDLNDAPRQHITANDQGVARIPLSKDEVKRLSVWGLRKGYTMQLARWSKYHQPLQLPASYELKLYPASPIHGRVLAEDGTAVKDAKVDVTHTGRQRSWSSFSDRHDLWGKETKTDAEGRWTMNGFPDDLTGLSIRVSHPDYKATTDLGKSDYRMLTGLDYGSLRDGTSVIKLSVGDALVGKVVDESGQPLAGCCITIGRDIHGANLPVTETGTDGSFRIKGLASGKTWLSVEPKDHQPLVQSLNLPRKETEPLVLKTKAGRIVRGRAVHEDGTPCVGLNVMVDRWREVRTLTFETTTDKDGRFEWKAAPEDTVTFYFGTGQGREFLGDLPLKASDEEQQIVIRPALRVQATVVDARTQQPVAAFRVTPGHDGGENSIYWDRANAMTGLDGHFEWETRYMQRAGNEPMFLIEAEGYEPMQTEAYPTKQQTVKLALQLIAKR